jgi:hypothetical protein
MCNRGHGSTLVIVDDLDKRKAADFAEYLIQNALPRG